MGQRGLRTMSVCQIEEQGDSAALDQILVLQERRVKLLASRAKDKA